jgi:tRNA G10  N-methylase Trm11
MFIAILGRQPDISLAELEAVYGVAQVRQVSAQVATVVTDTIDLSALGGTTKIGKVITTLPLKRLRDADLFTDVSKDIVHHHIDAWRGVNHKITLGISAYNLDVPPRLVQKTGLILKSALKKHSVSLRLVPNDDTALSTAVSHNNKLGLSDNKVELMVVKTGTDIIIAESRGAQNITAYARRDHGKPKRDAFVGMLPPKLAQIMINLALGPQQQSSRVAKLPETSAQARVSDERSSLRVEDCLNEVSPADTKEMNEEETRSAEAVSDNFGNEDTTAYTPTILDPFCGTGTVLQEALLQGYDVLASDLSDKMIDYTQQNLDWIVRSHRHTGTILDISQADATTHTWPHASAVDAVVCETYLGQPFSAPPSPAKLKEVVGNCNHIISSFLKNIHPQLRPGTPLCIAVPAWRGSDSHFTHLPLTRDLAKLGYTLTRPPLVYSRPDQVVARELLVLTVR